MTAIIDYDAGNIKSVEKALQFLSEDVVVTRDPAQIESADKVILPGVGAFSDAMHKLEEYGLTDPIRNVIRKKTPFLGICLGLQLLFEESEESPGVSGLGILKGKVVRFPEGTGCKIPQIGWNSLSLQQDTALFRGLLQDSYVYFVHSYYLQASDPQIVAATTEYAGVTVHAAVAQGNLYACQFHPEKSGGIGLQILSNFAKL